MPYDILQPWQRKVSLVAGFGPRHVYSVQLLGGFGAQSNEPQLEHSVTGEEMNAPYWRPPFFVNCRKASSNFRERVNSGTSNVEQLGTNSSMKLTISLSDGAVNFLSGQSRSTISNIIADRIFLRRSNALGTWHIAVIIHVIVSYPNINAMTAAGSKSIFPSFSLIASANLLKFSWLENVFIESKSTLTSRISSKNESGEQDTLALLAAILFNANFFGYQAIIYDAPLPPPEIFYYATTP